jgi:hypothetical protein
MAGGAKHGPVLSRLITHDVVEQQRALLCVVIITLV